MKINIVCVGTLKENYFTDACKEYQKRIGRFCDINIVEIKERTNKEDLINLKDEAADILNAASGYVIALCVEGKIISSENLSKKMEEVFLNGNSQISFIIGSSNGLHESVKSRADFCLSFSEMTFPHQLMRVVLLEQIYRAFTISNNIKYHK